MLPLTQCLALVIRDEQGQVIAGAARWFDHVQDALISELGRSFVEFKIAWVSRDANSVAHCCACLVSATERVLFWLDYIPEWHVGLAANDCTPIID
jgi:hypothetical protein